MYCIWGKVCDIEIVANFFPREKQVHDIRKTRKFRQAKMSIYRIWDTGQRIQIWAFIVLVDPLCENTSLIHYFTVYSFSEQGEYRTTSTGSRERPERLTECTTRRHLHTSTLQVARTHRYTGAIQVGTILQNALSGWGYVHTSTLQVARTPC